MASKENNNTIAVAALPDHLRDSKVVKHLERDENGDIDVNASLHSLAEKKKDNKSLWNVIFGLLAFCLLLIACNFGTAVAAARLSKETEVDPVTGFAMVKGGDAIMKTSQAIVWEDENPGTMSEEKLGTLTKLRWPMVACPSTPRDLPAQIGRAHV